MFFYLGNPAATSPYTVNKDTLKGPAWANSLFEDNAEHGFGMYLGQKVLRDQAIAKIEEMAASDKASAEFKAAAAKYIETKDDTKANTPSYRSSCCRVREGQLQMVVQQLHRY